MSDPFARDYAGDAPFEEVWFLEGSDAPDRGFWIRYTLRHGPDGASQAIWAARVAGGTVEVGLVRGDLFHPTGPPWLHDGPAGRLSPVRAVGDVGSLAWDLDLAGSRTHDHVPARLLSLGVSGRHYRSARLDLSASGTLRGAHGEHDLVAAPGVLGHISGRHANTAAWAWCHAGSFDQEPAAVFEGLSARLHQGITLPWATSLVLAIGGRTFDFTRIRQLFRIRSDVGHASWSFEARRRGTTLRGRACLPGSNRVVRVTYDHANGQVRHVRNSPLARLDLTLIDEHEGTRVLTTERASLELAGTDPHSAPTHLRG